MNSFIDVRTENIVRNVTADEFPRRFMAYIERESSFYRDVLNEEAGGNYMRLVADLRREMGKSTHEAINFRKLLPIVSQIKNGIVKSSSFMYKKFIQPRIHEIYDSVLGKEAQKWCNSNAVDPCKVPGDILRDMGKDVKRTVDSSVSQRLFTNAVVDTVKTLNPINMIKLIFKAFKRHGFKLGLKIALITVMGDFVIPALAGLIHPTLVPIVAAIPFDDALTAYVLIKAVGEEKVFEWLKVYEEETGEAFVPELAIA